MATLLLCGGSLPETEAHLETRRREMEGLLMTPSELCQMSQA